MRKLQAFVLTVIFVFTLALTLYAADKLKEEYNKDTGEYRYYLDKSNYVTSSKQLGKITEGTVKLTYNDYTEVSLKKDDEYVDIVSGGYIFEEGNYILTLSSGTKSASVSFILKKPDTDFDAENVFYSISPLTQAYSADNGMYLLSVGNRYTFYSSVPNYCITDKPVKVYMPSDEKLDLKVYKDGSEISFASGKTLYETGYYVFETVYDIAEDEEITDEEIMSEATDDEVYAIANDDISDEELSALADDSTDFDNSLSIAEVSKFSFCIIDPEKDNVGIISPPQDHIIASVTLDGKKINTDKNFFKAEKDGSYRLIFKDKAGILPDRTLAFKRDTKPPALDFENVGRGGIARGSFRIIKKDDDSTVTIYKNGEPKEGLSDVIEEEGLYRVMASDSAGNSRVYLIRLKKNFTGYVLYAAAAIFAAAAGIWLYSSYVGKNIHIR